MKVLFFANTEWYLYNFRLALARFLRDRGFEVVMVSPPGVYGPRLEAAGFRWITVPMQRRSLNPVREAWLILQLIRLYARERPDLVHNFTIKSVIYGALAARIVGIKPRVHAVTGLGYVFTNDHMLARLLRPFVRFLLRVAMGGDSSRLILQNEDDCSAFEQARLIAPTKIRLIRGSGVDTQRFAPALGADRVDARFRVLLAARLLWKKGLREYISAASSLKEQGLSSEFLLAGTCDPGNPDSATDEDVERWRREGSIRPLGDVADMAALLRECDLMVLPSSYREGVPRSLIEAAASGLPIVTTDTPGCRDIVADGVTGLLVAPGDGVGLATAIRWMVEHPQERARMGAAGRQRVLAEFDERLVFDRTLAVYRELLPTGS